MNQEMIGFIGILVMLVMIFAGMWVSLAMAFVGFIGFIYVGGLQGALANLATTTYNTVASYNFAPIPLFVLMGSLVSTTGVSGDLYNSAYKWFGQLKGGLALATCVACAGFAAICGSSIAGVVTMGKVCLPEMRRHMYDERLATGVVASGGTLGILIPPSIGLILYGIITENSVGKLFMAGIVPGIMLTSLFMATVIIWTLLDSKAGPPGPATSLKEKFTSLKSVWIMGALFLLILGGLYLGYFTPTESGAIGAFGAVIITMMSRRLTWKHLLESVKDTGMTTAKVGIMIIGAYILMRFLAISQLPTMLADVITGLQVSPLITLIMILVFYIILGMFLDILSAIIFTIPIIYPVITGLGFDPIWFGVVMVIIQEMGLVTPPIGLNVFALGSVTDVPMVQVFKGALPFVLAMIVCTAILVIFPEIVLFLPNGMMR